MSIDIDSRMIYGWELEYDELQPLIDKANAMGISPIDYLDDYYIPEYEWFSAFWNDSWDMPDERTYYFGKIIPHGKKIDLDTIGQELKEIKESIVAEMRRLMGDDFDIEPAVYCTELIY